MKQFAVHTNQGVFIIAAHDPDEARKIVLRKHPGIIINKCKAKR